MAQKCLICSKISPETFTTNESILGKNLSILISNISGIQLDPKKPKIICQCCAVNLMQAASVVEKLNCALSKTPMKFNEVEISTNNDVVLESNSNESNDETTNKTISNSKNSGVFQCEFCKYTSNLPIYLKKHLVKKHNVEKPRIYKCDKCSLAYQRKYDLRRHSESVHEKKLVSSTPLKPQDLNDSEENENHETFNQSEKLEQNSPSVATLGETFQCDHCVFNSTNAKGFKKHLKIKHQIEKPRIFKCTQCPESYQLRYALNRHMELKHQTNKIINDEDTVDDTKLASNSSLQNLSANHEILKKCPYCQKSFLTEEKYLIHVRKETCKSFQKSDNAVKGINSVCDESSEFTPKRERKRKQENEKCTNDFESKPKKKKLKHASDNVQEIKYLCYLCPFKVNILDSYKEHMWTTHEIKKSGTNLCSQCLKSYPSTKSLRRHFKSVHVYNAPTTDQKKEQHTCFICNKYFPKINELRMHLNDWHDLVKICPNCGKVFRSEEKLQVHVFSEKCKTSIYPCQDPYCNKRFSRLSKVRDHMIKMHNMDHGIEDELPLN